MFGIPKVEVPRPQFAAGSAKPLCRTHMYNAHQGGAVGQLGKVGLNVSASYTYRLTSVGL
jgi:hypothetical protein